MIFNPDLSKQAQEVILQKHLGLTLDIKLNFSEHIKSITKKNSKTMDLLRKFQ